MPINFFRLIDHSTHFFFCITSTHSTYYSLYLCILSQHSTSCSDTFCNKTNKSSVNSPLTISRGAHPVLLPILPPITKPLHLCIICIKSKHVTTLAVSHSLSCFEVPHVCRGTPGLLIIALPADLRASIPRCVCVWQVDPRPPQISGTTGRW